MTNEPLLIPTRKRLTSLLSAGGVLLLLLGAGLLFFQLISLDKKIQAKKTELNIADSTLRVKLDSIKFLDTLVRVLLDQKRTALEDSVKHLPNKDSIISASVTEDNILKADLMAKVFDNPEKTEEKDTKGVRGAAQDIQPQPVIYIQVNDKITLLNMQKVDLLGVLKNKGYAAYGYEAVRGDWGKSTSNTICYFHQEDEDLAKKLAEEIKQSTGIRLTPSFRKGFAKVQRGQLELWIKTGA